MKRTTTKKVTITPSWSPKITADQKNYWSAGLTGDQVTEALDFACKLRVLIKEGSQNLNQYQKALVLFNVDYDLGPTCPMHREIEADLEEIQEEDAIDRLEGPDFWRMF